MNTNNIKKYAPKARREFMDAVAKRLNTFGITANKKGELQIAEANLQGSVLQIAGNSFDGKLAEPRKRIVARSQKLGYAQLIEQVAYTWFNRLCAIRYMEIHDYLGHGFRVLSHPDNPKGFEIIDHAQDAADELGLDRARIVELKLAGNKDEELYCELLLGQCHKLHEAMPFLFDALDDETELLLPDNLTRTDSILRGLVDGIPEEDWQQVEVIGWLYQFYISEKKDQVMGKVVKSEDIPAATQLFTPNWIVKYLVQNSVGRQWLQTYPDSAIKTQMEYYIEPAEQSDEVNQQLKAITPESIEPETIKVLDPACGSGHILIEAYNVLKAIYEERGFRSRDIPKMILENNLYGLDIDDRAAQLSGFALMMMARDDDKRIFTRNVRLNVLSLQESNHLDLPTLWKALNLSGSWQSGTSQGLFSDDDQDLSSFNADNRYQLLKRTLARFTQAKTFGSLIDVPSDEHEQLKELLNTLVELQESGDSMQKPAAKQLIEIVHQALVLSIRYDAVIANPPYMGSKAMNRELKDFLASELPEGRTDLMTAFIARESRHLTENGLFASVTLDSWLFLGSFLELRKKLFDLGVIDNILHIGWNCFPQGHIYNRGVVKIFKKIKCDNYKTRLMDLSNVPATINKNELFNDRKTTLDSVYESNLSKFYAIPDFPFAFSLSEGLLDAYQTGKQISTFGKVVKGLDTCDNDRFTRLWYEVNSSKIGFDTSNTEDTLSDGKKWYPYSKGGSYRKWYGNYEYVVNWENDGAELRNFRDELTGKIKSRPQSTHFYFNTGLTFGAVTSSDFSCRYMEKSIFGGGGNAIFVNDPIYLMGFLNSDVFRQFMDSLNPTINMLVGDILKVPLINDSARKLDIVSNVNELINIQKETWHISELSWGFERLAFILDGEDKVSNSMSKYIEYRNGLENKLQSCEELNDEFFRSIYSSEAYSKEEKFNSPKFNIPILELLSYSVGCMIGRYSLDREGLVYAHAGNDGFEKLVAENAYQSFAADEDGIIPLTDKEWFKDDATNRFREFIQVVWGEEHLQANLDFVAESLYLNAIKPKKSESALETIRRYLSTQFYKDHLKTYKKRPIYWLFSSGKQKAFECLVYLHRYNEGTLSRMRTEYVTPLLGKYDAYAEQLEKQIETADSTSEANRFKKELDALIKKQVELREFDDKLKHYADMRISLDLDDGVKVNYGKFGDLLADVKAITGSAPEVN
ncbi:BREX-1 system adenine-specific DNA-methyltransferase PglX [Vibrio chagasii]|uniref:BREX-1 system adenine-specific DNA-methyltransferase PglX n=1 Tax=Vibrio chagasii TaxID=170679 RepID=UPI003DA97EBD